MDKQPLALHITDTHLSENTIEVNISVFQQAFQKCHELGINKLIHGGDIFTSRKGQPEVVLNAFKSILDEAQSQEIVIIALAGNHDKVDNCTEPSYLDPFTSHPALRVMSPYGALAFKEHDLLIHFLPYYDEDLAYRDYLGQVEVNTMVHNILITHVAINGVRNNDGTKVKNEIEFSAFKNFDLVLVGHYHNRQKFANVVYTGSTHQANFGEDDQKGATILFSDLSYEFISFDTPSFRTFELNASEIDSKLVKQLTELQGNVRLKMNGDYTDKQRPLITKLESLGVKLEKVKQDYQPIDVIAGDTVQINTTDILEHYSKWAVENEIEDSEYGLKILEKCLQ